MIPFRVSTIIYNAKNARQYSTSLPSLSTYRGQLDNKPFKGYNLLIKQPPIKYLTFEGGGAKGVAYVGVMESLQRNKILNKVEAVAGSSAGAMQAMLFGMGYSTSQMRDILFKTNMNNFLDISQGQETMNWIQKAWRTSLNITTKTDKLGKGVFLGEVLQSWLKEQVKTRISDLYKSSSGSSKEYLKTLVDKNGEVTFSDIETLKEKMPEAGIKTMHFTGTNITSQSLEVFNSKTTPDMPIYKATRISASFPWAFKSVIHNGSEYMDGGALNNYPMQVFDNPDNEKYCIGKDGANLEALGIRVDNNKEILEVLWKTPGPEPSGFLSRYKTSLGKYFVGVDFITAGRATDFATYEKYPHRTIQVFDMAYNTLNFNLSDEDKLSLIESGRSATDSYISNYFDERTAISIKVDKLEDLKDYITKETLENAAKQFDAQLYVQTDLQELLKDLPFDYFTSEIQRAIEQETKNLLESNPYLSAEEIREKVISTVHEKLFSLLESSLKSKFNEALQKGGYDPKSFNEVFFDVLQYTNSDSPVNKTLSNIVDNVDGNGNSFLDNVVKGEIARKKSHDLNQSADDIQKQIDQYDLAIADSKREHAKIKTEIDALQEKIDSAEQQDKQSLIEKRTELERDIEAEREKMSEKEKAKEEARSEKEKRENPDWESEKSEEQNRYEKERQERESASKEQQGEIFKF